MSMTSCVARPLRIAIALSGGVDSAVAALLLRRCVRTNADVAALRRFGSARAQPPALTDLQAAVAAERSLFSMLPDTVKSEMCVSAHEHDLHNREVELYPFFLRCWHDDSAPHGWCAQSQSDYDDAQRIAHTLELLPRTAALSVLDYAEEYAAQCFQRMLHAYAAGNTLNVDVLCNSRIKFGVVAQALKVVPTSSSSTRERETRERPQQTLLATGHYARTWDVCSSRGSAEPRAALLLQPCSARHDLNDQTHFLSRVPPSTLAGALFPIGHLFKAKADVRTLAQHVFSADDDVAHIARKRTSTGICFVGAPPSPSPSAFTTHSTPPSCKARFASFLNEFLPPPPPSLPPSSPPRHTAFREATTNTEKMLVSGTNTFGPLKDDYPAYLPAYAVTLGQRLRLADAHSDGTHGHLERYCYVARKRLLPASSSGEPHEVRLLEEVLVVDRWDHPLLCTSCVGAVSLRWWLPTDVLRRAAGGADGTHFALPCLCALRHQMAPQPAVIRWARESEAEVEARRESADGLCVRSCTVHFEAPVRAPATGQALVVYASLSAVKKLLRPSAAAVQAAASMSSPAPPLAVIGSGWVAPATADEA
ncbi:putative tRNA-methyl transferase [Leptomonas pyrrhocoris]|uniref:Putative tRNA-methyl transferase n=1 Tax=Leptomonas pyrrhocoris TaxID=157538 RepID=A0A0M9FP49_LEPPY|nr:putative tRNA-methyl transferase [Leptomonas pyrrhocoris]XP_015651658.1 putative tRNA-methyl transferase [Leptomonas pyrrhocoris]XP_015651659.1 putative tRNA-methyl transferase [Leptomonas pyrrhocoris]KPA73218.1 putative tRNA-methyl transferase [Leptomonas pyrrhocoris]KPA73219.1 putative tRNA-methyl transferase [Leptomonas pyrrhocoris]KPA73220.1 putative tRNA-methyl transferase [Leptomonas pyrrhocoris]|eukprot:XP_015651657.1 putative tRNA-methyl transferase [Leptomonas pyrrhocoris]